MVDTEANVMEAAAVAVVVAVSAVAINNAFSCVVDVVGEEEKE